MTERTFSWFPHLTEVLAEVCRDFPAQAGEFALAVAEYGTSGKEPEFSGAALKYAFLAVRENIDLSVAARTKNKGGRPSKKTPGKTGVSENETGVTEVSGTENGGSENSNGGYRETKSGETSETPPYKIIQNNTVQDSTTTADQVAGSNSGSSGKEPKGCAAFIAGALAAWNEQTGQDVLAFPADALMGLRKAYDNGRTLDDVRSVLRKTAGKWEPRYLTPNAVFGDKFEQWLNQPDPKPERKALAERQAFEPCPECGKRSMHVEGAVYDCPECGKWEAL